MAIGRNAGDVSATLRLNLNPAEAAKIKAELAAAMKGVGGQGLFDGAAFSNSLKTATASIARTQAALASLEAQKLKAETFNGSGFARSMATATAEVRRTQAALASLEAQKLRALSPGPLPALNSHLKGALGSANSLGSSIGGLGSRLQQLPLAVLSGLVEILKKAAIAAVALGVTIATVGLQSASTLADTRLAIGSLGDQLKDISAEDAVQSLRDLSVQSGLGLAVLSKFEQGFVSLGVSGKDSLTVLETTLSALAATGNLTQASMQGVGRALQQIGSKPLLQLEELNQIADQIPAASRVKIIQQLAKDTGDSIAEVQERFRLGTQQSGDALTAVVEVIKNLDTSGQALENRTKTIGGAFSKAKADIKNSLADAFTPLGTQLAEEINKIDVAGLVDKVAGPIQEALSGVLPDIIAALPDVVEGLAFVFSKLAPLIGDAAAAAGTFASAFIDHKEEIDSALSSIGDFLGGIRVLLQTWLDMIQPILPAMGLAIKLLGYLGELIQFLAPAFRVAGRVMAGVFNPLTGSINLSLLAIQKLLQAVSLIPGRIPILGAIADQAGVAAGKIASLRNELSSLSFGGGGGQTELEKVFARGEASDRAAARRRAELNRAIPRPRIAFPNTGENAASAAAKSAADAAKKAAADTLKNWKETLRKIREDLSDYANGTGKLSLSEIQSNYKTVVDSLQGAIRKAQELGWKNSTQLLKNQLAAFKAGNKQVIALAKQRDAVVEKLKVAKDALKSLREESVSFVKGIKDGVIALGSVAQASSGIDVTFSGISNHFRKAIADTRAFTNALDRLRAGGLNETSLRQLAEAGPGEGLRQAQVLASAGAAGIQQINGFQTELERAGGDLATGLNTQFYSAGIKAAEGLVKGLTSQQAKIVAAMDKIADSLVARIKKQLKIKSPSQVFQEDVGAMIPAGIVRGVRRGGGDVEKAMDRLALMTQNAQFGAGSVQVNGVSDPERARRAGLMAGEAIQEVLNRQRASQQLAGVG